MARIRRRRYDPVLRAASARNRHDQVEPAEDHRRRHRLALFERAKRELKACTGFANRRDPGLWADLGQSSAGEEWQLSTRDRDRGTPHGATPPTPPGIRVTYPAVRLG